MQRLSLKHAVLGLCLTTALATAGFAQSFEIHPLIGRNAPTKWADSHNLKSVSIIGVKGAVDVGNSTQLEGELEYLPHFEFRGTDPEIRGWVWGLNLSKSFSLNSSKLTPFYTFGLGGVTAQTGSSTPVTMVLSPDRVVSIDGGDTFLSLSYGVGVKALRVIGPAGLRVNVMGRTMPNYFNRGNSWAEFTGGLVFTFGSK
jgi:hypothetical protein